MEQSTHLADTDQQRATQAAQALADQYKAVADAQRARADRLERDLAQLQRAYALLQARMPSLAQTQAIAHAALASRPWFWRVQAWIKEVWG